MAEPTSTTLTVTVSIYSLFIAIFGVTAGEWATIVFGSLAGSLWVLGNSRTKSRVEAVWLLLRTVTFSAVFVGLIAAFLETQYGFPAKQALAPVAFIIGFYGDKVGSLLSGFVETRYPKYFPPKINKLPGSDTDQNKPKL